MAGQDAAFRIERDTMGEVRVPVEAYYGAQTQRAVENFPVSGIGFPKVFIKALGMIKKHSARVNGDLGLLDAELARAITEAAGEVAEGKMDGQFVVDIFQTGSGTSTNMNANEVIATRANEILTGRKNTRGPVHPNDHVNMGQSSNDVIPTAIHVAALTSIGDSLLPALEILREALKDKATAFDGIVKIGRTHLQDAVPIRLGQEFSGYARQVQLGMERVQWATAHLAELALGGTAVGTGLNSHGEFASRVIEGISKETGYPFREAENHFEAQAAQDAAAQASGALKTVAVSLMKIANDIRWLSSGPRCGIGEIDLPSLQPGSSIMPGKVNPVIPEAVIQIAYQVMGNDTAITLAGQAGNFELNVTLPLLAHNLLESIRLLAGAARMLADKCLQGLAADEARCASFIEQSLALVTALVPRIGYDRAADLAKKAHAEGLTVRQVALKERVLPQEQIDALLG
jgi:fumarate hydratase class II